MTIKQKRGGLSLAQGEYVINKTENSIHLKTWPKITTFQQGQSTSVREKFRPQI